MSLLEYREAFSEQVTPEKRIEWLQKEVKRVKLQRNQYEQTVFKLQKELNTTKAELALLESFINRTKNKF